MTMAMNDIIKDAEKAAQNLEECIDTLLVAKNSIELDATYLRATRILRTLRIYARRRVNLLNKEDSHGEKTDL